MHNLLVTVNQSFMDKIFENKKYDKQMKFKSSFCFGEIRD